MLLGMMHVIDELDVFICTGELLGEGPNLLTEFRDESCPGVIVDGGAIGNEGSLSGVGES